MFMLMLFGIAPHQSTGNKSTNMEMAKITDRFFEKLLDTMTNILKGDRFFEKLLGTMTNILKGFLIFFFLTVVKVT